MLDLLLTSDRGLTLTEISNRLNVPKSTAHAVLKTMQRHGYVSWDAAEKGYSIGLRLVALASAAPVRQRIQVRARPALERLATELQETAILHAFEGDQVVAIDKAETERSLRYSVNLGKRWPMHASSAGKLYLAELDDAAVRSLAQHGLAPVTSHTIVDVDELLAELDDVRRNGYAFQTEEAIDEVAAYAAPVRYDTQLVAALTVTGPTERIHAQRDEITRLLLAEARALSGLLDEGSQQASSR